jgi:hypothetical protein
MDLAHLLTLSGEAGFEKGGCSAAHSDALSRLLRGESQPMPNSPILAPVVALVAWTLVMQIWMYATRLPAMRRMGIDLKGRRGGRGAQLDGVLADEVQWKAHNYNHLLEQPTLFYAIALTLALLESGGGWNLYLAWAYVGLRIVHSLIQATSNVVRWRFLVFTLASLMLLGLTLHAGMILLHIHF